MSEDSLPPEEVATLDRWRRKLSFNRTRELHLLSHAESAPPLSDSLKEISDALLPAAAEVTADDKLSKVADDAPQRPLVKRRARWAELPPPLFPKSKSKQGVGSRAAGKEPAALTTNQVAPCGKKWALTDALGPPRSSSEFACTIS